MPTGLPSPLPSPAPASPPVPAARRAPPAAADRAPAGRNNPLRRLGAILYRFRWVVPLPIVAAAALGVAASRQVKPEYVARATVWVEADEGAMGSEGTGPIRSADLLQSDAWVELLRSYAVLDPVVREERLYLSYPVARDSTLFRTFRLKDSFRPGTYTLEVDGSGRGFQLAAGEGVTLQRGAVGDSVGSEAGFAWLPPPGALAAQRRVEFEVTTPRDAAYRLGERLVTRLAKNGTFLRLELEGTDPRRIASTLNTLTERYVTVAGELKRARLKELEGILQEQLAYAAASLQEEETALQRFRVGTITLPTDRGSPIVPGVEATQDPAFGNFFGLNLEREQVRRDREALQRAMGAGGGVSVAALEVLPSVQRSSQIAHTLQELTAKRAEARVLAAQYTDLYKPLARLQGEIAALETQTIPALASSLLGELNAREATLEGLIRSASGQLRGIPPRAIEEARLRRRVDIAEDLYKLLQQRYEEARLAAVTSIPDVRVLDEAAVPYSPVRDPRLQIIFLFSMAGVGLVVAGAVLFDRFNPRLAYPEQVTEGLGLPILGAIPRARAAAALRGHDAAQLSESFRNLRLGLVHASGAAGPFTLTITSPGSGDGKSFVSSNLAATFSEQGQRTVLVDGDVRRGSLHRALGCSRKPGLMDYLAGERSADEIIQRTPYPNLDFIAVGTRSGPGPELLGTGRMAELFAHLRATYGVILVDSPPMGACVDPLVLATLTRDMLVVLRTDATDRQLAEWNLQVVDRLPIRVLGAAVNGISVRGVYRAYGYMDGYAYESIAEDAGRPALPAGVG
jgi:capsular exopolysaccharide synthesis family protein